MEHEPDPKIFRLDRPGIRAVLGSLEAEIMEDVWARPQGSGTTIRDVFEPLSERRRIAYTSVMNTMARLARKSLLRIEKQGNAYVYYPVCTQEEFISRYLSRALENLVIAFAREGPGPGELAGQQASLRVKQLVDEITRRRAAEEPA